MNIKQIVETYLKENGYDGLFNGEESYHGCGCCLDDLFACNGDTDIRDCQAGYKEPCDDKCEHDEDKEFGDWHISLKKPEEK